MIGWDTLKEMFLIHSMTASEAKAARVKRWVGQFLVLGT